MLVHLHPSPYRFARRTRSGNRLRFNRCARLCVRIAPASDPPSAQSPFARDKALPSPSKCLAPHRRALPRLPRSCGLMRQSTYPFPATRFYPRSQSLCRLLPAPARSRTFPTLSLRIFPRVPDPYPGGPQGAFTRFFPQGIGLPRSCSGSALNKYPGQPLPSRGSSRGCSHFVLFRPASLFATQVAPTAAPSRARGSHGFYVRAPHGSLPPRGPDMLGVRIEQLTPGRLPLPKIRSLVGCSARSDPIPLFPALVHGKFMFLSGEICPTCGPCSYGSRTEGQPERAGIAIEP